MSRDPHQVVILERVAVGQWRIRCSCWGTIAGVDPIDVHRRHQDHIVAEYLAEQTGVEREAS